MIPELILAGAGAYIVAGAVFAVVFLARGIGKVDAAAAASGKAFRLIVTPGVVALWPVLWRKWKESHRDQAVAS
jgi:hypothetical protein